MRHYQPQHGAPPHSNTVPGPSSHSAPPYTPTIPPPYTSPPPSAHPVGPSFRPPPPPPHKRFPAPGVAGSSSSTRPALYTAGFGGFRPPNTELPRHSVNDLHRLFSPQQNNRLNMEPADKNPNYPNNNAH